MGITAQAEGAYDKALALFTESLDRYRDLGYDEGIAWSLDHLGRCHLALADHEQAQRMFADSMAIFRRLEHAWGTAICLHHQGLAALASGNYPMADDRLSDGLAAFSQLANDWGIATSYDHLGYLALATNDLPLAQGHFARTLAMNRDSKNRYGVVRSLAGIACAAVAFGDLTRAALLFGAVDALGPPDSTYASPVEITCHRRGLAVVRAAPDREDTARAWSRGRTTPLPMLISLAADWSETAAAAGSAGLVIEAA